jgi:hypothetical protein
LPADQRGDTATAVKYLAKSEENMPFDVAYALNLAICAITQHQLGSVGDAEVVLVEDSRLITRLKENV